MLAYFLKGSKRYFAASMLFGMLVSTLDLINPRIIAYAVDTVIDNTSSAAGKMTASSLAGRLIAAWSRLFEGGASGETNRLIPLVAAVLAVALLGLLCRYLFKVLNAKGEEKLVRRMRDRLYEHIVYLPLTWHSENQTGDIIQRCTSDVDTIRKFLAEHLTNLVRVVILIVFAILFMVRLHPGLALAASVFVPVVILYSVFFYGRIGSSFEKVDEMEGKLSAAVQENLTGIRVVRAFGREAYEDVRFKKNNEIYIGTWTLLMRLLSVFWAVGDAVIGLQVLVIIVAGAALCIRGSLTAGEFIAFISYNTMLTWPVRMLGRVISEMSKAGISVDRIRYIMNSEMETDAEDAAEPDLSGDIVFEKVSFGYGTSGESEKETDAAGPAGAEPGRAAAPVPEEGGTPVLRDVSFRIPAGSVVGILGGTGSGKSTLVYLLDRLLELDEDGGRILIGGVDIRKSRRKYLRENIGIVLQEPYLFSGTLAENIALTESGINMQKVRAAVRAAALEETVAHFSQGYETYVGERGVTLSGGQKQRTAIAQMLLRRPRIMIFDDSLSAVDAATDVRIREALQKETGDRTTILIAHRISTLMHADRIVVLDRGRVVEQGTHEELLSAGGLYRRTFDLQQPDGAF